NSNEVFHRERVQLDSNRKAALQLGNQIRWLGHMKGSGSNKKYVVGSDEAVSRVDGSTLDNWQDVTLYAFAANIRTVARLASSNLVDFIEKNDSAVLDPLDSQSRHLIHVD